VFLDSTQSDDDTGVMSYVRDCVYNGVTTFIPIGTCEMMNVGEAGIIISNEELGEQLAETKSDFQDRVGKLESVVDDLVNTLDTLMEKMGANE